MTTIIIILLITITFLGFVLTHREVNKLNSQFDFTNEFRNKFVELSNKYYENYDTYSRSGEVDNELYHWLTKNSIRMQGELGRYGIIEYIGPFRSYVVKHYEVILNTLPKYREGKVQEFDANTCDDTLIRYLGLLEESINKANKKIKNPFIWFQKGIRTLLSFPIYLLNWFGIINENSLSKITGNILFKIFTGIIALVAFISSIVTIIQGRADTLKFIKELFEKNASH